MSYGFAVAELTDKAVTGVEPHEELFQLIVDVLKSINSVDGNMNLLFWYFEIHLLSHMGFHPSLSKCPRCSVKFDHGRFSLEYGELVCDKCNGDMGTPISARALGILRNIQHGTLEDVISIVPRKGDRQEIGHFLIEYMRYHIEGLREVKSSESDGESFFMNEFLSPRIKSEGFRYDGSGGTACYLIHGFTGSTFELDDFGQIPCC